MNQFEHYSIKLFEILSKKKQDNDFLKKVSEIPSPRYLIRGDVSGIQGFIFTIPSKYASKELKARSEYIKKYTSIWLHKLREKFGKNELLTGGGGNFYLFAHIPDIGELEEIEKEICVNSPEGLYLALSWINADNPENFESIRTGLAQEGAVKKMRKYAGMPEMFRPCNAVEPEYFHLTEDFRKEGLPVWSGTIIKIFREISPDIEDQTEAHELPETGNIISFSHLSWFAGIRTGTPKIAVLKMDIDNLGKMFSHLDGFGQIKQASECLEYFFSKHLFELLGRRMKSGSDDFPEELMVYRNNIYVVFSGGDDCFIIGAWDAVLEFAVVIREEFRRFIREDYLDTESTITLSSSVQLYNPHYPVYKFAAEAEINLHEAKYSEDGIKDKIFLFGEVFTWMEFDQVLKVKEILYELIAVRKESRAILNRIKQSAKNYEHDRDSCLAGMKLPHTWMMNYTLGRNIKTAENRTFAEKNIMPEYESNLLRAYFEKKSISAMIFPVAARYTELLTRNTKS